MPEGLDQPATKADLGDLEERLKEFMRDIETRLLKAFHGYAELQEHRVLRIE
jgi:hypothetical protein